MFSRRLKAFLLGAAIASLSASTAAAQVVRQVTIRVHVADSSGAPVPGADISIVRGLAVIAAHGFTDAAGAQSLSIQSSGKDVELIVRKLGYVRTSRFFPDTAAPVVVEIKLAKSARTLDTVKVAEREDPVRKSYFIDADAIENSPRLVDDALDIVMKLRPDMVWSRTGRSDQIGGHVTAKGRFKASVTRNPQLAPGIAADCGDSINRPVANIWVNGSRIRDVPVNPVAKLRRVDNGVYIDTIPASILASIKPEHVAEMQYHPCTESQQDVPPHTLNAIMVQLKEGIGFDPGTGSYVLPPRVAAIARTAPAQSTPVAPPTPAAPAAMVPNRGRLAGQSLLDAGRIARILGVFDEDSGNPVVDVDVVHVSSGTRARTTATGTVSLLFLPPGESELKIERVGYTPKTLTVTISLADTVPITVVLTRAGAPPARDR